MSKRHFENLAQKMRNIFPPKRSEQRNTHSVSFEELIDAEGDPELAARIIELDQIATDLANGDIPITPELIEATAQYVGDLAGAMIQEGIESGRITQIEIPSLDMIIQVRPKHGSVVDQDSK